MTAVVPQGREAPLLLLLLAAECSRGLVSGLVSGCQGWICRELRGCRGLDCPPLWCSMLWQSRSLWSVRRGEVGVDGWMLRGVTVLIMPVRQSRVYSAPNG